MPSGLRTLRTLSLGLVAGAAVLAPVTASSADPPLCEIWPATIVGTEGPDVLVGTIARDVIVGLGGDDHITGGVEGDIICGDEGNDTILSPVGLRARGGDGNDHLEVQGSASPDLVVFYGDAGDDVLIAGGPQADLYGGGGDDVLLGGPARDYLDPGWGNDTIDGGAGRDTLSYARFGGPLTINLARGIVKGQGRDTITNVEDADGTPYDDRFVGDDNPNVFSEQGAGLDVMHGRGGDDTLYGYGTLLGGRGDDLLVPDCCEGGAPTDDTFDGGSGFDTLAFSPYEDLGPVTVDLSTGTASGLWIGSDAVRRVEGVDGTPQDDVLTGDGSDNAFEGKGGDDQIFGAGGNDTMRGGYGADFLYGGDGDDYLDGERRSDTLDGGPGVDECVRGEVLTNCEEQ